MDSLGAVHGAKEVEGPVADHAGEALLVVIARSHEHFFRLEDFSSALWAGLLVARVTLDGGCVVDGPGQEVAVHHAEALVASLAVDLAVGPIVEAGRVQEVAATKAFEARLVVPAGSENK